MFEQIMYIRVYNKKLIINNYMMHTKTLFNERRSVNYFDKNKSIDEKLLKEIIDMAVLAPSGFNLQPWRIIAVKSDSSKMKLLKLANNQEKFPMLQLL